MATRERSRKLIVFIESLVLLAAYTFYFGIVWYQYYIAHIQLPFFRRGNYAVIGMYALLMILFQKLYGGFKVDSLRTMDVLYSQILSLLCVNVVFYVQLCMIGRDYMNPIPLAYVVAAEVGTVFVWVMVCRAIYRNLFPPAQMLLVYGKHTPKYLISKMETRKDKYHIAKIMHISEGMEEIRQEAMKYEAVVISDLASKERNLLVKFCYENSIKAYITPKISDLIVMGADRMHLFDTPLLVARNYGLTLDQRIGKRCVDLFCAAFMLILTSPIMLIIALCIKLYDLGPVFYRQTRVTQDGREFRIYKFRSMGVDSEARGARLAMKNDNRVTPVGKIIRNLHFDELPQLINILAGDMSMVGPRPERPEIIKLYKHTIPEFDFRLKVKAGLTGYAQVYGKYNTTPYDKLKLDVAYIENYSIWLDIKLMLLTFKILFQKENTEGVDEAQTTAIHHNTEEEKGNES